MTRSTLFAPALLLAILFAAASCGDDGPTAPSPQDIGGLSLRNLILETPDSYRMMPEFNFFLGEAVDTSAVRRVTIDWPGAVATTEGRPEFEAASRGSLARLVDRTNDRLLVPGQYVFTVEFDDGGRLEHVLEDRIGRLGGPSGVQFRHSGGSFNLDWVGPDRSHQQSLEIWAEEGGELTLKLKTPPTEGRSGSGGIGRDLTGVAPGQRFVVRLILENDDNRYTFEAEGVRQEG